MSRIYGIRSRRRGRSRIVSAEVIEPLPALPPARAIEVDVVPTVEEVNIDQWADAYIARLAPFVDLHLSQ